MHTAYSHFVSRRFDLQIAKYTFLIIGLILTSVGCGNNKAEVHSAADSMAKNKMVRIVTDAVHAPFEFGTGTGVQGLDVDLGNEVGKDLGIEVKWVKSSGYEHLFELLKEGGAEILISASAIDPQKMEAFAFSDPYFESGDAIARRRDVFDIKDLASLSGKKVGVGAGRPGEAFMASQTTATGVSIVKFSTLDDALGALNRGELDAIVGDEPILTYSSYTSYQNTITLPELINKYQYAVVVRKNDADLLKTVNATIDRLKQSGEIEAWTKKWFATVREDAAKRLAEDMEQERLKKAPKTIDVRITKVTGTWKMDRLDGFVLVLEGEGGRYESTPILTEGNNGRCRFNNPVPPGEYSLNISILQMQTTVPVPPLSKKALSMNMRISRDTTISFN
jgi:ABC-type amino acid transport substrate-binding protein